MAKLEEDMYKDADYRTPTYIHIKLSEDIYCITFLAFLKGGTSNKQLEKLVLKCVLTFALQIMIVSLLMKEYFDIVGGKKINTSQLDLQITAGTPKLNLTRLFCSFLLHILILREVQDAMQMLRFAKKLPTRFSDQRFSYPMLIGMFKMTGGLLCFITNIFVMLRSDNIEDVVKDFVALGIIAEIDDLMAQTLDGVTLDRKLKISY